MDQADVHDHPNADGRTNEQWLSALHGKGANDVDAQHELRSYIRRGLGRAFGGQDRVDDALLDDLTQDALLRITIKLDSFRGESLLTTWAMSIAIRVAYSELRRRRWGDRSLEDLGLSVEASQSTLATAPGDPAAGSSRDDLMGALRVCIERDLTPRQRSAILGELAGMPADVLAQQLDTNTNALYKLHHDARLRLRAALEERGFSGTDVRIILQAASNG